MLPRQVIFVALGAIALSVTSATQAAVYRVSGGITSSFSTSSTTLDSYDNFGSEINGPRGFAQYIAELDTPAVHGLATSTAGIFGLRAGALAIMSKDFAFGSDDRTGFGVGAFASGMWTDFIVTGPAAPANIPISVNVNIDGSTLAGTTISASGRNQASSSVQFNIRGNNQLSGGSFSQSVVNGAFPTFSGTGLLTGFDGNMDVTSPLFSVPVNTPFSIELQLSVASSLSANFSEIFTLSANTNFLNTVTFAPIGPVFNLPAGYTINSVTAGIVDNTYVVPETSSLVLSALGLMAMVGIGKRARRVAASK